MNWKEHPFAIAVAASAATITLCATLVFTAIIPTWLKSKDNEIAILQTEPTRLKSELDGLSNQLRTIEAENLKLRRDLDRLSPDSLFSVDDVYPRGFRSVRIGDRVDLLSQVYSADAELKKDDGPWISVAFHKPGLFSQITYYYDEGAKVKTVTHVLFHFAKRDRTFDLLKQELIDKYSQATMKEKTVWGGKKQLVWSGLQKHTLELSDSALHISRVD